jgi:hypothetical protein
MDNLLSKAIKDIITSDDDFIAELQAQIDAEVTAQIDHEILKKIHQVSSPGNPDLFLKELFLAQEMLPLLKRAEKFFLENPRDNVVGYYDVYSDCGNFLVRYIKDYCIQFFMKSTKGFQTLHRTAELHFQNINLGNFVNEDTFSFSPMNKGMKVLGCNDYKLNDDLEHDEAWYFQKMTQVDLPPEEYFIAVQEVLKLMWEGQYVEITISMDYILGEPHVEEYRKLVQKLEEQNAEHN